VLFRVGTYDPPPSDREPLRRSPVVTALSRGLSHPTALRLFPTLLRGQHARADAPHARRQSGFEISVAFADDIGLGAAHMLRHSTGFALADRSRRPC
jgi:hypothetical protein